MTDEQRDAVATVIHESIEGLPVWDAVRIAAKAIKAYEAAEKTAATTTRVHKWAKENVPNWKEQP